MSPRCIARHAHTGGARNRAGARRISRQGGGRRASSAPGAPATTRRGSVRTSMRSWTHSASPSRRPMIDADAARREHARYAVARDARRHAAVFSPRCARAATRSAWCRTPTAASPPDSTRAVSRPTSRRSSTRTSSAWRSPTRASSSSRSTPAAPRREDDLHRRHLRDRRRRRAQRRHPTVPARPAGICTAKSIASASTR